MNESRPWIGRSARIPGPMAGLEVLGSILALIAIILVLDPIVGKSSRLMALLGIGYWGVRRGMIGGIVSAILSSLVVIPALAFLMHLEPASLETIPLLLFVFIALGAVIGRMSDLREWLRLELAAREGAEALLVEERESFRIFFEGNPHPMWILDEETLMFSKVNRAMVNLYGYSMEDFGRMHLSEIQVPENLPKLREFVSHLVAEPMLVQTFERKHRTRSGSVIVVSIVSQLIKQRGRRARLGQASDITEQERKKAALEHEANHDALTGLANRASFHRSLARALGRAREDGGTFSLFLMDLDRFKGVNDSLGHAHGDLVLQQVAHRLLGAIRPGDFLARLGGDEFGLLLEGADPATAKRVGDRLLASFVAPFVLGGRDFDLGVSIGLVTHPEHGEGDQARLLHLADAAMYDAKRRRAGIVSHGGPEPEASATVPPDRLGTDAPGTVEDRPSIFLYPSPDPGASSKARTPDSSGGLG